MKTPNLLIIVFALSLFYGCGSTVDGLAISPGGAAPPSSVSVTFTAVGTTTPAITSIPNGGQADVQATVRDIGGNAVSGIAVSFAVTGGAANGTLFPASATTNASGVATVTLTAVATDQQVTVTATATIPSGGSISNTGSISVGTVSNPPSSVAVSFAAVGTTTPAITSIGNGGACDVRVLVRDASNNPLAGVTVNFSVSGGVATGVFSAASAVTDALGVATVTFTAAAANTLATFTASINVGASTINNTAVLTIGTPPPPTPATVTLTVSPLTVNITGQATVTVTAKDASGNPAFNSSVTLGITAGATLGSFSSSDPALDSITQNTDAAGQVVATFYAGSSSGLVTIRATCAPLAPKTQSLSITSDPASIDLQAANPNLTVSGTTQLTADVRNIMNNPVSDGTSVAFALTAGATNVGTLSSATATTVNGIATVTFTADANNTGTVVVTATAGTAPNDVSSSTLISVSQAATGSIVFDSATPSTISVQGSSPTSSLVKFIVKNVAGSPQPNVNVDFTLYGPTGSSISPLSVTTRADGSVTTTLTSGSVAGPARIVATVSGMAISTSGTVAIGGGVPSASHFDVSASRFNLEGLNCNNVQSTFTAFVADRFGNYNILKGTTVSFTTEAGAINTSGTTGDTGTTTVTLRTQAPQPVDTTPMVGEPNYTFGGRTYNPRDGWVTVLVRTTGEESFVDNNANGNYSAGEPFTDLTEPFVDMDDSGTRTAGEQFFDWPAGVTGNTVGAYDGVNGVWDAQIPIFKTFTLVFSGAPHIGNTAAGILTSRIECIDLACATPTSNITIANGSSALFKVYVSDINMNTIMPGSSIDVKLNPTTTGVTPTVIEGTPFAVGDGLSYGPTELTVRLSNGGGLTSNASPTLKAEITWPGACTSPPLKTGVYYPGTITFTP